MKELQTKFAISIIIFYFICTFNIPLIFSQNRITYKLDQHDLRILKIYFRDSVSSRLVSFDITKENPYNKLKYFKKEINNVKNNVYQLTKAEVEQLLTVENTINYAKPRQNPDLSHEPFSGTSYFSIFKKSDKYVSIGYTFFITDLYGWYIFATSTILVYDCNGKLICRNKNINVNTDQTAVTDNGKFVAFNYGLIDDNGTFINDGFRIYSSEDNRLIFERQYKNIGYPSTRNNVIIFGSSQYDEESKYTEYVFDTDIMAFYTKKYLSSDLSDLKEITDKGFIFGRKGIQRIDTYENAFNKEIIK